jgi:hypothetical protein
MIYGCECPRRRCRARLDLTPDEYAYLAAKGAVVSAACAARDGRPFIRRVGNARAVSSFLRGGGRVPAIERS